MPVPAAPPASAFFAPGTRAGLLSRHIPYPTPNNCWDKLSRLDSAPALGTLSAKKWSRCFSQDAYAEDPTSTTVPG